MIYRLALIMETLSIIICTHRVYNQSIKVNIKTIAFILTALGFLEACIQFQTNNTVTACIYLFLVIYCIKNFRDTVKGSVITAVLVLMVISVLQFLFVVPTAFLLGDRQELRMLITNGLVVAFTGIILPGLNVHKLHRILMKKDSFLTGMLFGILCTALLLIFGEKFLKKIPMEYFVLAVPMLIFLIGFLIRWNSEREEKEEIKNELHITRAMQEKYDDLLTAVRLREHGFKNHLTALLSLRYTNQSYEELVQEQDHYFETIQTSNKFNKLLYLGDSVLAGFLYKKLSEAETSGIEVTCEIKGCFTECVIPVYYVVEMLGILIDNAVEAQTDSDLKGQLKILFQETEADYQFKILNPFSYTNYAIIESWFQKGNSSKGTDRGLGLYQLKKLCQEHNASITCENIKEEQRNWIKFTLRIGKADES